MNQKDIEFIYQNLLYSELSKLDLSENTISSNALAQSLKNFIAIKNIYSLRSFIANFKKLIEGTSVFDSKDPYLCLILKGLVLEILYGNKPEIKGSLKSIIYLLMEKEEKLKNDVFLFLYIFLMKIYIVFLHLSTIFDK